MFINSLRFIKIFILSALLYLTPFPLLSQSAPDANVVEVHGMLRIRPEVKSYPNFLKSGQQSYEFVGQKAWISIKKEFTDGSHAQITIQDARIWGGQANSPTALDSSAEQESTDIREAYLEINDFFELPMDLQLGRQKLVYGDQRLIGHLDWTNIGRSFDTLRIKNDFEHNSLHVWSSIVQEHDDLDVVNASYQKSGEAAAANRVSNKDIYFSGIYNTFKGLKIIHIETYYLAQSYYYGSTLSTTGIRLTNKVLKNDIPSKSGIDYTAEGAYQFGRINNGKKTSAFATAVSGGYKINASLPMRFGLELDIASGDDDPTDAKHKTFTNLYHTNHLHYGQADLISWQNMLAYSVNITAWLKKGLSLKTAYWYLSRLEGQDSWYGVAGGQNKNDAMIMLSDRPSAKKGLAHEIDLTLDYKAREWLTFNAGYSIALRAAALKDKDLTQGKNANYQYAYLMTIAKF